jgi:hypothetical protein
MSFSGMAWRRAKGKIQNPGSVVYWEKCETNKIWFTDLIYRGGKKNADIYGMFPRNIFKQVVNAPEVTT